MIYLLLILPIILFISVIILEIVIFYSSNDLEVSTIEFPKQFKKVLIIFPHPDDEVMTTGGLINILSKRKEKSEVKLLLLSQGERGTPDASIDERLKEIRSNEAIAVSKVLKPKEFEHLQFPDNRMGESINFTLLEDALKHKVKEYSPDLLITYDQSGLYGHQDHIAVSQIVTEIAKESGIKLWYTTFPQKILEQIKLPEHMARNTQFKQSRRYPSHKIYVGILGSIAKHQALMKYKSQYSSLRKTYPSRWLPIALFNLPQVYEYFYEVRKWE